jgi:excisionase family DNA binding protein
VGGVTELPAAGQLWEARHVAAVLSVPVSWVREQTRRGEIPCVRLGRYVRYRREDVERWIEGRAG